MDESIQLNKKKKIEYREITQGKSDIIYTRLMIGEGIGKILARPYDRKIKPYTEAGIDLFCQEFKTMHDVPLVRFQEIPDEELIALDTKTLKKKLKKAIQEKDLNKVQSIALQSMEELSNSPHHNCMTRHLLESIIRLSYFYPKRKLEALKKNLEDPIHLYQNVLTSHIAGIDGSVTIDKLCYPIQKSGVPILCRELPNLLDDLD